MLENGIENSDKIGKPPNSQQGMGGGEIGSGCGAQGADGDDVGRDERDTESSKCCERT